MLPSAEVQRQLLHRTSSAGSNVVAAAYNANNFYRDQSAPTSSVNLTSSFCHPGHLCIAVYFAVALLFVYLLIFYTTTQVNIFNKSNNWTSIE